MGPMPFAFLSRLKLRRCSEVGDSPQVLGTVWIHGGGRLRLGNRVVLDGRRAPIELHSRTGGGIVLGDDVRIEGGASLEAQESIQVGPRCRVGGFAKLIDNPFHQVRGQRSQRPESSAVQLGPDVEVGRRAIVLPGANIGAGARIGPGAVVGRHVAAGATFAGLPGRIVSSRGAP